jgi:group I intron endonuclease
MPYIYKITNILNGKIYIGQSTSNRWRYFGGGKVIKQALSKYGKHNFTKELLVEGEMDQQELDEIEIFMIWLYDSTNHNTGYNILKGGFGGRNIIITEETRMKMSRSHKGKSKKPFTTEHRKNLSLAKIGKTSKRRKPIIIYDKLGNFVMEAPSILEAARLTGNCDSNVTACCKGKKKSLKGFVFRYK